MPNHLHGIVWIVADDNDIVGATGRSPLPPRGPTPKSLGSFIAGYKSAVTKRINEICGTPGNPVWQRNYYEHIIRNEQDLDAIRRYVWDNMAHWAEDPENPSHNSALRRISR
ncbi:MAG TPA: hypothetical protein EYP09_01605 [Anaerolineae bacterium]|nr:hypothetical protein [Anaerolineae bacterium]